MLLQVAMETTVRIEPNALKTTYIKTETTDMLSNEMFPKLITLSLNIFSETSIRINKKKNNNAT